jgi:HK97 family phage major capsid protein
MSLNPKFKELIQKNEDSQNVGNIAENRARAFMDITQLTTTKHNGQDKVNFTRALSYLLQSDRELLGEVAYLQSKDRTVAGETVKGDSILQRQFDKLSKADKEGKDFFTRALDADSNAGANDLANTLVEDSIIKRVEQESKILDVIRKKSTGSNKDVKFPLSSNTQKAGYVTKSADLPDISAGVEGGISSITIEPEKFGALMFVEGEFFVKITPGIVSDVMDELRVAYRRGLSDQIFNGNGSAPNATGLALNATPIAFSTNIQETLIKMFAAVSDANRGSTNGLSDIFIATNMAGGITLEGEKFISWQHNALIDAVANISKTNAFLNKVNIIYDDMGVLTSGTSPNKSVPLYVGVKNEYLMAEAQEPQVLIDPYTDFKAVGQWSRIVAWHSMKPAHNDSFAKTTIPAIY